jgi:hypothetical protein
VKTTITLSSNINEASKRITLDVFEEDFFDNGVPRDMPIYIYTDDRHYECASELSRILAIVVLMHEKAIRDAEARRATDSRP